LDSSNAIVYPPPEVESVRSPSRADGRDWTLVIVTPIAGGIFFLVLIFFCWAVSEKTVTAESFDYERKPIENYISIMLS
jgi:hypothetical protein